MKINFLGDVFLDKKYKMDISLDNFIFNLEYPLSKSGIPAKNKINLGADKQNIYETFGCLPIAVNLANNHIMDYGEESFLETINYLNENNISYFGAGNKDNNYNNPCLLDFEKKKIALLGYSCPSTHSIFGTDISNGAAPLDLALIEKDILEQNKNSDYIIINLHWGDEEISYPKPTDIVKARKIIDMGADLIIGHHAHVIQSMETYRGKKIFYGIGNFLFPNLDVPSMFNGSEFTNKYKKIQNKKNRESIIVKINDDLKVNYKTTFFDNKKVVIKNTKIPKWLPKDKKAYKYYYKIWSRKRMLELYLKNPRVPTLKQIKLFLGFK
jgi:poly-gamma-glutamate synthesis protein (capsule biosynthesis protein)